VRLDPPHPQSENPKSFKNRLAFGHRGDASTRFQPLFQAIGWKRKRRVSSCPPVLRKGNGSPGLSGNGKVGLTFTPEGGKYSIAFLREKRGKEKPPHPPPPPPEAPTLHQTTRPPPPPPAQQKPPRKNNQPPTHPPPSRAPRRAGPPPPPH